MTSLPAVHLTGEMERVFDSAWTARTLDLPSHVPVWVFLDWLTRRGLLLHGSPVAGLELLHPRDHDYGQADDFSNTVGVYACSDAVWAMMYALRGPGVAQQSDMALRLWQGDGWSRMRYFYSLAPQDPAVTDAGALLAPGTVYVLDAAGFTPSPTYEHGGLGRVQEAHAVHPGPVAPLWSVPVRPGDFPLPVRLHDAAEVRRRSAADPWGFPWLHG